VGSPGSSGLVDVGSGDDVVGDVVVGGVVVVVVVVVVRGVVVYSGSLGRTLVRGTHV
jgi:hypothetical protein